MNTPVNALAALLNRSLDDELTSLVAKHGADAVREATKRATAKKRGRKPEKDWIGLKPWIEQDADDWLEGRDPISIRSNYAIPKAFAEAYPGHNPFATKERIERKLRESRRWVLLVHAIQRSEKEHPLETYIRALRELEQINPHQTWAWMLERALGRLALYRERFGDPAPDKSFDQLETELNTPSPSSLFLGGVAGAYAPRGLFGHGRVQNTSTILTSREE